MAAELYISKYLIARNQSIFRIISDEEGTVLLPYSHFRILIINRYVKEVGTAG
jgi:hypothetical protein